jgi:endonuclease YncB( thermonuclease family)
MAIRAKSSSRTSILLLVLATALWGYGEWQKRKGGDSPKATPPPAIQSVAVESKRTGKYEVYRSCTLVSDKGNDGDSFKVRLSDGRVEIFRLYFVDAPESAFKQYRNNENNHERIAQQAEALGGITPEQAVEVGERAKAESLALLGRKPFTLYTQWDSPFKDQRYHAFVELNDGGKSRWLHEVLVGKGLARIHTKGAELPDGTSQSAQKDRLRKIEKSARDRREGAWGLR